MHKNKTILDMNYTEAKNFFLKSENYSTIKLPSYINFDKVLKDADKILIDENKFSSISEKMEDFENINYTIYTNKDGNYDWRPQQIIHPWVYVDLVKLITVKENWKFLKRILKRRMNKNIKCVSLPREKSLMEKSYTEANINNWWEQVEQESIFLALEYTNTVYLDISNCYGTIYTHTISWALHGKDKAKKERNNKKLLGNLIDKKIQRMQQGQTNGIPQGSALMDFIAELILSYIDKKLFVILKKAKIINYKILRYRDDYRIFSNSTIELERITKELSNILQEFNFKLNSKKTIITNEIVLNSLKLDKLELLNLNFNGKNLQQKLLKILLFSRKYPNSGSLLKILQKEIYEKHIKHIRKKPENIKQLISIIVEIIVSNIRTIQIGVVILSKLLEFLSETEEDEKIIDKIISKIQKIPNADFLNIWLQRLSYPINKNKKFETILCRKVINDEVNLFNSGWITMKNKFKEEDIIDKSKLKSISRVIPEEEALIYYYVE